MTLWEDHAAVEWLDVSPTYTQTAQCFVGLLAGEQRGEVLEITGGEVLEAVARAPAVTR